MTRLRVQSGQISALVLVGLALVAIPAGLSLVQGLSTPATSQDAVITPTLPSLAATETPDGTATSAGTKTSRADDGESDAGDGSNSGRTLVVDGGVGTAVLGGTGCPNATYARIQPAVDAATPGDTVMVCAGFYLESVTVSTGNITLAAEGNATIDAGPGDAVHITASNVTLRGFTLRSTNRSGVLVETARNVTVRNNTVLDYRETENKYPRQQQWNDGIRLNKTNGSLITHNDVIGFDDDQITVGEGKDYDKLGDFVSGPRKNGSSYNTISNNYVTGMPGDSRCGIIAGRKSVHTVIRNNSAINVSANPWTGFFRQNGFGICTFGNHTDIVGNYITRNAIGVWDVGYRTEIIDNTIVRGAGHAVNIMNGNHTRVVGNHISGRYGDFFGNGVSIGDPDIASAEVHRNVIYNNSAYGIELSRGSGMVNATNNTWGCGGPSSGLKDPITGRVANGSGDPISESDEPGVSNVHYDPFRVLASCPSPPTSPSSPTPTGTATSTQSPTWTATRTPTRTPPPPASVGTGTGGGAGPGSGPGPGQAGDERGPGPTAAVTSPPPTKTLPPTPTITPTPVVEPGFGIGAWGFGGIVFVMLLIVRRRVAETEREHRE